MQTLRSDSVFFLQGTQTVRDVFGFLPDVVGRSKMCNSLRD